MLRLNYILYWDRSYAHLVQVNVCMYIKNLADWCLSWIISCGWGDWLLCWVISCESGWLILVVNYLMCVRWFILMVNYVTWSIQEHSHNIHWVAWNQIRTISLSNLTVKYMTQARHWYNVIVVKLDESFDVWNMVCLKFVHLMQKVIHAK